jgi:hypothetical protein
MKRSNLLCGIAMTLAIACASGKPTIARADTVTEWNAIMQSTVLVAPTNPMLQARWAAITQLAVFEAVNAIEGKYEPYLGGIIVAPAGASPDAAAIAAAHRTLVGLRPGSAAVLDELRDTALAAIPDGQAKEDGIQVGEDAAAAMLFARAADGWDAVVPYTPGTNPGDWQPTPPANSPAAFSHWGDVSPFGMTSGSQFRSPPPPALGSRRHAKAYNEVKLLGRIDSPFRPQDRTDVARFFAASSPVEAWNSAARQASAAQGLSLSENARVFALLAMAICDASIATFDTKYHYNLWRPVTAIRAGDLDGNWRTEADPDWVPLITTPAFPSYTSGHATLSAAARRVLERAFGKGGHEITLTTPSLPDLVLNYTTFSAITDDIDDARIYGGIHFRFDQVAGGRQGRRVGSYILETYLLPVDDE